MPLALVDKIEKLAEQFAAALFLVKFHRLEHRPVVFDKAIAARDFAPGRNDVIAAGAIFGIKVAKAGQELHGEGEGRGKVQS